MRTTTVTTLSVLDDILALQRENLRDHVSAESAARDGFLTVAHTRDVLERMHALAPSIIAKDGDVLAGYALVMPVESASFVPVLAPMFEEIGTLAWRDRPVSSYRYYVMGQVCVARAYRGQGVFDALYREHRAQYASRYELCVTEIATRNTRSMRAHARVGFEIAATYRDALDDWAVVVWDWT